MNRVELIGRMVRDTELRTTTTGNSVVRFTLAVDRRKREDGADFINCTAFSKTAELIHQYIKKGHRLGISGHIQTGSYEKDGKTVYTTDVVADSIDFLESKQREEREEEFVPIEVADEDLPF